MSTEDDARIRWVKLPQNNLSAQKWWPALVYKDIHEAMLLSTTDTKILSEMWIDFATSDFQSGLIAFFLGDLEDEVKKYVSIEDIQDENHVQQFFSNFDLYDPSIASASLTSAINESIERLKNCVAVTANLQERSHKLEDQSSDQRTEKGGEINKSTTPKKEETSMDQTEYSLVDTPPPHQITTNNIKKRGRPAQGDERSSVENKVKSESWNDSISTNTRSRTYGSGSIGNALQNLSSTDSDAKITVDGSSKSAHVEDNSSVGLGSSTFSPNPISISSTQVADSWKYTWGKLQKEGWTWKKGSSLDDFHYLPPNGNDYGIENVDFFTSQENVLNSLYKNENGNPVGHNIRKRMPVSRQSVKSVSPRHQASTEESDSDLKDYSFHASSSDSQSEEIQPNDTWVSVWEKLTKNMGWTWKSGSGVVNFYYIPPNGKLPSKTENAVRNQDYFTELDDVKEHVKEKCNWNCDGKPIVPKGFHLDEKFDVTWQKLKLHGWRYDLNHQIYIVPGGVAPKEGGGTACTAVRRRVGEEGVDYFKEEGDVVSFLGKQLKKGPKSKKTRNTSRGIVKSVKKTPVKKAQNVKSSKLSSLKQKTKTTKLTTPKKTPKKSPGKKAQNVKSKKSTTAKQSLFTLTNAVRDIHNAKLAAEADTDSTNESVNDNYVQSAPEELDLAGMFSEQSTFEKRLLRCEPENNINIIESASDPSSVRLTRSAVKQKINATKPTAAKKTPKKTLGKKAQNVRSQKSTTAKQSLFTSTNVVRDIHNAKLAAEVDTDPTGESVNDNCVRISEVASITSSSSQCDMNDKRIERPGEVAKDVTNNTPIAKKVDSTESDSATNIESPTGEIAGTESRNIIPVLPPLNETIILTEETSIKPPLSSVTAPVQRDLAGVFYEQSTVGKKMPRCQLNNNINNIESASDPSPVRQTDEVLIKSLDDLSELSCPVVTSNKEQRIVGESDTPNRQSGIHDPNDTSLPLIEQAKENMRDVVKKKGIPVQGDDEWINVLAKMNTTPRKRSLFKGTAKEQSNALSPTPSNKRCKLMRKQPESTPKRTPSTQKIVTPPAKNGSNHTPTAMKVNSIESVSVTNVKPPMGEIAVIVSRNISPLLPLMNETIIVTEAKSNKTPKSSVSASVQRDLVGAFSEKNAVRKKMLLYQSNNKNNVSANTDPKLLSVLKSFGLLHHTKKKK